MKLQRTDINFFMLSPSKAVEKLPISIYQIILQMSACRQNKGLSIFTRKGKHVHQNLRHKDRRCGMHTLSECDYTDLFLLYKMYELRIWDRHSQADNDHSRH